MAMKDREAGKIRLATIRMIRAAQQEAEIAKRDGLSDDEMLAILNRELKKRRDVVGDYEKANRGYNSTTTGNFCNSGIPSRAVGE